MSKLPETILQNNSAKRRRRFPAVWKFMTYATSRQIKFSDWLVKGIKGAGRDKYENGIGNL